MNDPTPESEFRTKMHEVSVLEQVRARYADGQFVLPPDIAQRRIDAYVAERTAALSEELSKIEALEEQLADEGAAYEVVYQAFVDSYTDADAMAEALQRISDWRPTVQEMSLAHTMADEADAALAAYRALSVRIEIDGERTEAVDE